MRKLVRSIGLIAGLAALSIIGAVSVFATPGVYDYTSSLDFGTFVVDITAMIAAVIVTAVAVRLAFKGARIALKTLGLVK